MKKSFLSIVIMLFVLTGCSSPSISLNSDEGDIPSCALGNEPIPVEMLDTDKKVSCKLADVDLVFPDGTQLNIDAGAHSGSTDTSPDPEQRIYSFYSVGVYGFAVGFAKSNCKDVKEWGSTIAKEKTRKAFGEDWACKR